MELPLLYQYGVASILGLALVMFIALFFITAPYGRHRRTTWGPNLNPRLGWVLMELPSVVWFAWVYFHGAWALHEVPLTLFCLWELHYAQRTFVYPTLLRSSSGNMPISIVATGGVFNVINATLNALALTHLPSGYSHSWFTDPRFLLGTTLFFVGFAINLHSDHILRNLRKPGSVGYRIPYGGLFRWVTSPNYLGEIVEWFGWMLASWSLAGASFALFTFANLTPRAWAHHKWYYTKFPNYPRNRKALIPKVF